MDNGSFEDIGRNLIILLPIILLILFNIFFRKRRGERTQPEIIISLLSEITINQQVISSGIYIAVFEDEKGEIIYRKFAVVR